MEKKYYNEIVDDKNIHLHDNKNPLVRWFYKTKFNKAIKLADLNKNKKDVILDFGCGKKSLSKIYLKDYKVFNYDVDPKCSEIDYKKIRPTKVFVLDVFEHMTEEQMIDFIHTYEDFALITIIPKETIFWRKARVLMGLTETEPDHITNYKKIIEILDREMIRERKINFVNMCIIARYNKKYSDSYGRWLNNFN